MCIFLQKCADQILESHGNILKYVYIFRPEDYKMVDANPEAEDNKENVEIKEEEVVGMSFSIAYNVNHSILINISRMLVYLSNYENLVKIMYTIGLPMMNYQ